MNKGSLSKNINLYSFISLKTLSFGDQYPYNIINYSGKKFSADEIREMWDKSVKDMISGKAPPTLGLYIHIPFCITKCLYCFCDSYVPNNKYEIQEYLSSMNKEMDFFSDSINKIELTSLYFGGGTPSYLDEKQLSGVYKLLNDKFRITQKTYSIFDGSPKTLIYEKLKVLKKNNINRITIGVQSLDIEVLKNVNRLQEKEEVVSVIRNIRKLKIPYINLDLMDGLKGQTLNSFMDDLKFILKLMPDNIHINGFIPASNTLFSKARERLSDFQIVSRAAMVDMGNKLISSQTGFKRVQSGNDARCDQAENSQERDTRSLNASLLGIGIAAQSHIFGQIYYQHPFSSTIKNKTEFLSNFIGIEVNYHEEMRKFLITNLYPGFKRSEFKDLFFVDVMDVLEFREKLEDLEKIGKLKILKDEIASNIDSALEGIVLSKYLYSKKDLDNIWKVHKGEFNENVDYGNELEYFYPDNY